MSDPGEAFYNTLSAYSAVEALIADGQTENDYLECKAPGSPQLDKGLRAQLAEALSGFSNSGGGVILWGVATTKNPHTSQDILTQVVTIGHCKRLATEIDRAVATLTTPTVQAPPSRVLHPKLGDTKGVVVTYVPPSPGDPVRTLTDHQFYIRAGDSFAVMPYELIRRMFGSAAAPDLHPVFDGRIVKHEQDSWTIPIILQNNSSTAAHPVNVSVEVENPDACDEILALGLKDVSDVNPGDRLFIAEPGGHIYRGLNSLVGSLVIKMKKAKLARRVLRLRINIFADRMRARSSVMSVQLAKKGFSVKQINEKFLY